jgi:hypothetical protein
MSAKKTDEGGSFWTTLPGIITAITGLIVAIGGLITVLGDEGILKRLGTDRLGTETPTAQINTPDDIDDPNTTTGVSTPTWEENAPCYKFLSYDEQIEGYDGVILAWSLDEVWVRISELEEDILSREDVTAKRFPKEYGVPECLAEWIKFLSKERDVHWPVAESSNGRVYSEVWLQRSTNFDTGSLNTYPVVPDMILITVGGDEDYFQIYECGVDVPFETKQKAGYWYAATDEAALEDYVDQYLGYNYDQRPTVPCQ